jgi:heme-degrading monooxygenase HmoA
VVIVLRRTKYLVPERPDGPVYHAATHLHRSPGWAYGRKFSAFNRSVEAQLESTPGALAYSLQRLLFGRDFWTLSLWSDRESMVSFVRAGSHRVAADWLKSTGATDGKFAQWESPRPSLDFSDAYPRLGVPPPRGRLLLAPTRVPASWRGVPR